MMLSMIDSQAANERVWCTNAILDDPLSADTRQRDVATSLRALPETQRQMHLAVKGSMVPFHPLRCFALVRRYARNT